MPLEKRYQPTEIEPQLVNSWQLEGIYHFDPDQVGPVYSIDTPPPTVSGHLHLGHVYSYSHTDFIARFQRMNGRRVFYPMGYDDNGLPTERLVEKRLGITARNMGRGEFIKMCLKVSAEAEIEYENLWQRLGLSIDWRYTYRTIDRRSRIISQRSYLDLYQRGLVYRKRSPAIYCPECRTTIAQADLEDLERQSEFITLAFKTLGGEIIPIATTRPELLPACVAVFAHPSDARYAHLSGRKLIVPHFGQSVPVLFDPAADPEKGTGIVMCCTFGDTADVAWWQQHLLALVEAVGSDGRMTGMAGELSGLTIPAARKLMIEILSGDGLILDRQPTTQSVRVHERCDTPVEYLLFNQWFIRILDFKNELVALGDKIDWRPDFIRARYKAWVENLNWDWCISRQRFYGVPFPLWYCTRCGEVTLAHEDELPVDPLSQQPAGACTCGSHDFIPESDVMDTWATSSLSPQIVGQWLAGPGGDEPGQVRSTSLYPAVFPFSLRPQAHEIIRTWAFYTIAKSFFHFQKLPWKTALISGWGLAGAGMGKISKSRGGGPMPPLEMIRAYSADAVRYWAASAGPGRDAVISEEKIQMGARLVTKLWNVGRFCEPFLSPVPNHPSTNSHLTPADRWILAQTQLVVRQVTEAYQNYDYATARNEMDAFFWSTLADNYLEMAKQRLYDLQHPAREAARATLNLVLLVILKLFAPLIPFVTEALYQGLYSNQKTTEPGSIHRSSWPVPDNRLDDPASLEIGELLVQIATAVRRYKSERSLSLGTELPQLIISTLELSTAQRLSEAQADLASICRAKDIRIEQEFLVSSPTHYTAEIGSTQVAIKLNLPAG